MDNLAYRIKLPPGVDAAKCTVQATLYYQSIPPYYLNDRFQTAPDGEATKRLYYLTSNLNLAGTAIENWELKIVSHSVPTAARTIPPAPPGNQSLAILSPPGSATLYTTSADLAVRIGREVNRNSFRAFLNGREITGRFAPASNLACTIMACDLVATVNPSDGLRTGNNELRVEARGSGSAIHRDSRFFTMK